MQLLAEFQRRQQQELLQQQEQARLHVAQRFHTLYMLHASLCTWHKHASLSAALRKLHPTLPLVQAAIAGANIGNVCEGTDKHSSSDPGPAQQGTSRVPVRQHTGGAAGSVQGTVPDSSSRLAVGLLDPAVVQQKAQLLLQHLANKAAGAAEPQQPGHTQQQAPEHTKQQKEQKQMPQQQGRLAGTATRLKKPRAAVTVSTKAPVQHQTTHNPADVDVAKQEVQQQAPLPSQQQQQQQEVVVGSSGTGGPLQETAECAAHQALATDQRNDSTAAPQMSAADASGVEPAATVSTTPAQPGVDAAAAVGPTLTDVTSSSGDELQLQQGCVACSELREPVQDEQQHSEQQRQGHEQQQQQQQQGDDAVDGLSEPQVTGTTDDSSPMQGLGNDAAVRQQPQQATTAQNLQKQDQQKGQQQEQQTVRKQNQPPQQQQQQKRQPEQVQQQEQLEWPQERQRLQQQIRQLQAEEQRRYRQYQQVEQQLQAVLSQLLAELAAVHATRVLVRRAGLEPWLGLMKMRAQQWHLAGRLYQWHLLHTAMTGLRHAVLCR
jgi:hypothetical protein